MRIALQVGDLQQLRKICLQERKETKHGATIALGGTGSHGGREILEWSFKNLLEDVRGRWGGSLLFWPQPRRDIGGNDHTPPCTLPPPASPLNRTPPPD